MTSRIKSIRAKKTPQNEINLKTFYFALSKSKIWIHIKYILERLFYLLQTLLIGSIIQYIWNFCMIKWFNGEHTINIFEAAILWICVY